MQTDITTAPFALESPARDVQPRTVPPGTNGFIFVVQFLGLWANRGLVYATSNTVAGLGLWFTMWAWRVTTFGFWLLSRPASVELKAARERKCDACPSLEKTKDGKRFCGSCSCPRTKYSELTTKNGREGHNCPLGLHPGSVKLSNRPCSGGGCKKKKKVEPDYVI